MNLTGRWTPLHGYGNPRLERWRVQAEKNLLLAQEQFGYPPTPVLSARAALAVDRIVRTLGDAVVNADTWQEIVEEPYG